MNLFKYVIPDRIDVLETGLIRFTQPAYLNDPHELRPPVTASESGPSDMEQIYDKKEAEVLQDIYKSLTPEQKAHVSMESLRDMVRPKRQHIISESKKVTNNLVTNILNHAMSSLREQVGILSLTEDPLHAAMWAIYASGHTGLLYEFDSKHAFFNSKRCDGDEFNHIRAVRYVARDFMVSYDKMDGTDALITKHEDWAFEKEWRILKPLKNHSRCIGDVVFLFEIPKSAILSVTCGCKATVDFKLRLKQLLAQDQHKHLHLYQMDESGPHLSRRQVI